MFGTTLEKSNDAVLNKLIGWYDNLPDYYDVEQAYKLLGEIKSNITLTKRDIERIEEQITVDADKPRSNDAKKVKLAATSIQKDKLANLQAQLDIQEAYVKRLEFRKTMFQAATYAIKMKFDL